MENHDRQSLSLQVIRKARNIERQTQIVAADSQIQTVSPIISCINDESMGIPEKPEKQESIPLLSIKGERDGTSLLTTSNVLSAYEGDFSTLDFLHGTARLMRIGQQWHVGSICRSRSMLGKMPAKTLQREI